jgi:hypothetical protein
MPDIRGARSGHEDRPSARSPTSRWGGYRGPFLPAVAAKLAEAPELLGDGHVARVAVEIQRRFWTPPDLNVSRLKSKERLVPYFSRLYARDLFPADAGPA